MSCCAQCDYPLSLPGGSFPCFGCELAELCPRCATADVPLCRDCLAVQNRSLQVVAEKKAKTDRCLHCAQKVSNFGHESNLCPIIDCGRVWGCTSCAVRRPQGLYCDFHISATKCGVCQHRYPIAGVSKHGTLWLSFSGQCRRVLCEVCDLCMLKVKTLVDSLLRLSIRKRQRFEKEVMSMIVRHAVEVLRLECNSAVLEWSKLDRYKISV